MRKVLLILSFVACFVSCKKDNKTQASADPRDKFVGTWSGNYTLNLTGLPPGSPNQLPTTIVISKSATSSSDIEIKINNNLLQNQKAIAVVSGNQYIYKPITVSTLTLNGTGQLSSDGKSISESGTASGSIQLPGFPQPPPTPISGTWSSALTK
jgi:hypothetical protein